MTTLPFRETSKIDWIEKIEQDLKGKSLESIAHTLREEIMISPAYARHDVKVTSAFDHTDWQIASQNIPAQPKWPDGAEVFSISTQKELEWALNQNENPPSKGWILQGTISDLIPSGWFENATEQLKSEYPHLVVYWHYSILQEFATNKSWDSSAMERFLAFVGTYSREGVYALCVDISFLSHRGAEPTFQLGFLLAFQEWIFSQHPELKDKPQVILASGVTPFFENVAFGRAFHHLQRFVQNQWSLSGDRVWCASPSSLLFAAEDVENNMLRSGSAIFSHVLGGAEMILGGEAPFYTSGATTSRSPEELGVQQQLLLRHEVRSNHYSDVGRGSYFLEALTNTFEQKAFDTAKSISKEGFENYLLQGRMLHAILDQQSRLRDFILSGRMKWIGVTAYRTSEPKKAEDWKTRNGMYLPEFSVQQ